MKKEEAYRDKDGLYVAFRYDGHVFVMTKKKKTAEGKEWAYPFSFCPLASTTSFTVSFQTEKAALDALNKIITGKHDIFRSTEWAELQGKNLNTFCVDQLKWKEWHEYQEVLRHKAPFAAIAVGNRVYKDTYSTALSDGSAWVFSTGVERLFEYPVQATHKIDQLLIALSQYPDMKLFDTVEERTEWSLKYLEEYAAKPEPTPVAEEQEVVPVGSIIDPNASLSNGKNLSCCAVCNGEVYCPEYNGSLHLSFKIRYGDSPLLNTNGVKFSDSSLLGLCQQIARANMPNTHACYTQSREGYELFIKAHISKEKQQELLEELLEELPGVDITEREEQVVEVAPHTHTVTAVLPATAPPNSTTERPPGSVIEVDSYKSADVYMSSATDNTTPTATVVLMTDGAAESWGVVEAVDAASPFILEASPDSQALTADSSIKTMKPGVTPQPSRSRIGKIAARPYEYVYDGPKQMGTTFVSRYRIDDEVWVRVGHELVKMKVTGIYVEHEQGSTAYSYFLKHPTLTIGGRAESELYDTLFDLISAMTSISVEELIAAAKEVV